MAGCGCGGSGSGSGGCSCLIEGSEAIDVTGAGSSVSPYIAEVVLDPDPTNAASVSGAGLMVDPGAVSSGVSSVDVGQAGADLTGNVNIPLGASVSDATYALRKLGLGLGTGEAAPARLGATVRGSIPYLNSVGVTTPLVPSGTAGRVLTEGVSGDPSWQPPGATSSGSQFPIIIASMISPLSIQTMATASGGAICDGVDDQVQIQAALDASADISDLTRYGRPVLLMPGTFNVNLRPNQPISGRQAAIVMKSGTELVGSGILTTVIKLGPQGSVTGIVRDLGLDDDPTTNLNYVITNARPSPANAAGMDIDITVSDFTVDGDSANQSRVPGNAREGFHIHGMVWWQCMRVIHERVLVKNMRGTSGTTQGETFAYDAKGGANINYYECRAEGPGDTAANGGLKPTDPTVGGTTATGFSSNQGTLVRYVNCTAKGLGVSGFTIYEARNVVYSNCFSRLNNGAGFNVEGSKDVSFSNCIAGGTSSAFTGLPWPAGTSLGNGNEGFNIAPNAFNANGSDGVTLAGCHGTNNGGKGLYINDSQGVRVLGGSFRSNNMGISLSGTRSIGSCELHGVMTGGNAITAANPEVSGYAKVGGGPTQYNANMDGRCVAPLVGASPATVVSPFPFDCTVYINSGTPSGAGFQLIDRTEGSPLVTAIPAGATTVTVPRGWSIKLTYSGTVPDLTWMGTSA